MFNIFIHTALVIMILMLIFTCGIAISMVTSDFIEKHKYKNSLRDENKRLKEEIKKLKS